MVSLSPVEIGKPFGASYEHRGDEPPTLNIVRTRLPATGVAFLSACHMAELTDNGFVEGEGQALLRNVVLWVLVRGQDNVADCWY